MSFTIILDDHICLQSILKILRPEDSVIGKWREEACFSGRFEEIRKDSQQLLDVDVANELRDVQVGDYMTCAQLREMSTLAGVKRSGNKDELIARMQSLITEINDTGTAVISVGKGRIPWVLSDAETRMVNNRFKNLVIPPYMHAFCTTKQGLFDDKSSCWRFVVLIRVVTTF